MPYKNKEDAIKNQRKWRKANPNYSKNWRETHKEELKLYKKNYRKENHEKILAQEQMWRNTNRESIRNTSKKFEKSETRKNWREKNKKIIKEKKKNKYEINKEIVKEKSKKYREKNPEKVKEMQKINYQNHKSDRNEYNKNKKKNNPNFLIRCRLATNLWTALKKYSKTGKIWKSKVYGIDYNAIIEHLKPFPKDISKYHIDHIRPLCSFELTDPKEVQKAFAPENHQWLTPQQNFSIGGRY